MKTREKEILGNISAAERKTEALELGFAPLTLPAYAVAVLTRTAMIAVDAVLSGRSEDLRAATCAILSGLLTAQSVLGRLPDGYDDILDTLNEAVSREATLAALGIDELIKE